jgi:endonuclease/exonuclease/phosphatase family metal-dependent hydrolase
MKPLRIATLNCLNLALPGRRFYGGVDPYTADEYIAKTQWLAAMLDRLAADVVLLQEVFHEQALADVVRQTVGGAHRWSLAAPLAPQDNDKPRLGIIWRQPWTLSWQSIAAFPPGAAVEVPEAGTHAAFARPLLRAEIPLAGSAATLTLVNVHLKSRRPDFVVGEDVDDPAIEARARLRSLIRRGAEAAALRRLLLAAAPEILVVAGDFNDSIDAATTQIVAAPAGPPVRPGQGSLRLFDAFDVADSPPAGGAPARPFTQFDAGSAERIDHLLVSAAFVPGASPQVVGRVAAVEVLADHLYERRRGSGLDRIYSDHAAVCMTLAPVA